MGEPLQITFVVVHEHNDWLKVVAILQVPTHSTRLVMINGVQILVQLILLPNSVFRKDLIKKAIDIGWSVGVARTFIHVDRRIDYTPLPQVVYVY